ncbi:trypsin-like peptidase domain-containing protein [Nocardia sp. NPDC048505]|uniref:S1C family serine protease n=1 Tax=unclassified Nocardia TaxID=2637762 RepID=UPI0033F61380
MTEEFHGRQGDQEKAGGTPGADGPQSAEQRPAAHPENSGQAGWDAPAQPYAHTGPYSTAAHSTGGYSTPHYQGQPFPGPESGPEYAVGYGGGGYPPPGAPYGVQQPQQPPRKPIRTGLVAGAVALALVSGGIGGVVGAAVSDNNGSGASVTNALDAPRPKVKDVANAPAGSTQAVAQKVLPSVVMIKVASNRAEGEGSGVVLSSDGLILTNNHVAAGAGAGSKMQVVFSDGSTAPATIVGTDPVSDLAVIKAEKTGLTPIELGSSADLQVGQPVIAIGSPLGLAGTVTTGIVSALNRPVSTSGEGNQNPNVPNPVIDAVQTDAAINPGNSGGALVDSSGKLIGINTAIASLGGEMTGQQTGSIGLGFAIPVDQARRVADQLVKTGHATYAQIGIKLRPQGDQALVLEATPDGPAAKAGIPAGVVITKIDDRVIDSGDSLIAAVRSHQPGDRVKVTYTDEQGNNPKTVEVTLSGAPA